MTQRLRQTCFAAMLAVVAASLAGCFELSKDATFLENGEARVEIEIAIAAELAAVLSNPIFKKQLGQEDAPDLLGDCGKPWPADKPLPDGVRSVESARGKRADMETCTFVADVSDPVAAVASAKEMKPPSGRQKMPPQDVSLVRLDDRPGYRLRVALKAPELPGPPGGDAANVGKAVLDAMFANRYLTLRVAGRRIENTNGELSPESHRVTWRLPITTLFDPSREQPVILEADILYK